ncbi:four-carbon acid sugar kinase family protein [Paenibacillus sp. P26]|nr:four-carbon acid sugar kinase family protein [Paenibacillus sp. P26]
MKRLAIIADDLTGASDSGVQIARKRSPAQVIFDWSGSPRGYGRNGYDRDRHGQQGRTR